MHISLPTHFSRSCSLFMTTSALDLCIEDSLLLSLPATTDHCTRRRSRCVTFGTFHYFLHSQLLNSFPKHFCQRARGGVCGIKEKVFGVTKSACMSLYCNVFTRHKENAKGEFCDGSRSIINFNTMSDEHPAKPDISAVFKKLRVQNANKVRLHFVWLIQMYYIDVLWLRCQQSDMGVGNVWCFHMHWLLSSTSRSRRALVICALDESRHKLDLAAIARYAIGRKCECGVLENLVFLFLLWDIFADTILPSARLHDDWCAAKV